MYRCMMMLRSLAFVIGLLMAAHPLAAKNLAFPDKDPVATIVISDKWSVRPIEFGWEAKSPNDDVYFSIEYAYEKSFDKIVKSNEKWMIDNKIVIKSDVNSGPINLGGLEGQMLTYKAVDENGPTLINFIILNAGKKLVMMTLWGSEAELDANTKEVNAMMDSIKLIQ